MQHSGSDTATRRPHLVHVITGLEVGGAEKALLKLIESTRHEFKHTVISLRTGGHLVRALQEAEASVHELGMSAGAIPTGRALKLMQLLRQLRPDLIQGWMYHGNIASLVGAKLARVSCPVVWSIHGLLRESDTSSRLTKALIWLGARTSRLPRKIIYKSPESQRDHEAVGYAKSKSVFIPNGFDVEAFRPDADKRRKFRNAIGVSAEQILVGVVARLHPVKDHLNFIEASEIVRRQNANARFVVVGRGADRIAESPAPLGLLSAELGDRLIALPEQEDMPSVMNALDIHIVSSASESFPNVLGEAMACGVPSVSTDVGACREILGDAGLVVPPKSSPDLARAILELVGDSRRRLEMGAAGRQRVSQRYSMVSVSRQYATLWLSEIEQSVVA